MLFEPHVFSKAKGRHALVRGSRCKFPDQECFRNRHAEWAKHPGLQLGHPCLAVTAHCEEAEGRQQPRQPTGRSSSSPLCLQAPGAESRGAKMWGKGLQVPGAPAHLCSHPDSCASHCGPHSHVEHSTVPQLALSAEGMEVLPSDLILTHGVILVISAVIMITGF